MFKKMFFVFMTCFAGLALSAPSQNLTYSWTVPTTRADGSALSASEISGYNLYYSVDSGAEQKVNIVPGSTTSKSITLTLPARTTAYKVVSQITAVDTANQESARSLAVVSNFTVLPAVPSTPGNFTITITCVSGTCTLVVQ